MKQGREETSKLKFTDGVLKEKRGKAICPGSHLARWKQAPGTCDEPLARCFSHT